MDKINTVQTRNLLPESQSFRTPRLRIIHVAFIAMGLALFNNSVSGIVTKPSNSPSQRASSVTHHILTIPQSPSGCEHILALPAGGGFDAAAAAVAPAPFSGALLLGIREGPTEVVGAGIVEPSVCIGPSRQRDVYMSQLY